MAAYATASPPRFCLPTALTFSFDMEGHVHYPNLHSHQAFPQGLPVSCGFTDPWLQNLVACTRDLQVSEETYSTTSGLDTSLQSTLVHGHVDGTGTSHTDDISPPSTLLGFESFCASPDKIVASSIMERGTRNKPNNQSRRTCVKASSRSPRHSAGMREVERPYSCEDCGKRFAQPQGVNRHYRTKHDPSSCFICGAKWSRPYQYRDHIEKHHPGVDPDQVLGKAAGSRRKATVIAGEEPFAIKHDRRVQAVSARPTQTLPALAAATTSHVPSAFSSTGRDAQLVNDVVGHAYRMTAGGCTVTDSSSPAFIPPLPPPVGGYYGSPGTFDRTIESSGIAHPYPFSAANYDGVWTDTFIPRPRPHTNIDPRRRWARLNWSY